MLFETGPTALETVHVYNPLSSSPGLKIVRRSSANPPPRYLLLDNSRNDSSIVHFISLTVGELSETLKT